MGSDALLPKNPDKCPVHLDIWGHSFQELASSNCVIKLEFTLFSFRDCTGSGGLEKGIRGREQEVRPGSRGDLSCEG